MIPAIPWEAIELLAQASLWVAAVRIATPLVFGTLKATLRCVAPSCTPTAK